MEIRQRYYGPDEIERRVLMLPPTLTAYIANRAGLLWTIDRQSGRLLSEI